MPTRGQLFFGTDGLQGDKRIAYYNEGTTGPQFLIIDNATGGVPGNLFAFTVDDIVVDSAAGFYYAIVNDGVGTGAYLVRGAISGGPATALVNYATVFGPSNVDPVVVSLAIDPASSRLYVGVQEASGVAAQSGIRQYTYNAAGAVTDNGFLVTSQSSGKPQEGGFDILLPSDFDLNTTTNTLFFSETLRGSVSSVGLFRLSLSSPNTIVQVVSQSQFPDSGANGFIVDVEVDNSTNITYFSTISAQPSPDPGYNSAQNQIWYVTNGSTATNATAVALTLFDTNGTTNFRTGNTIFFPQSLIFDQSTRQLYVASEQRDGVDAAANDDKIYVFQLNAAGTQGTLVNTIFPTFAGNSVNLTALAFNSLPRFSNFAGTSTAAIEQSAAVVATAAGSTVNDDGRLLSATVQVTGGTFTSTQPGINNDNLAVGAGLQTSGLISGTNITASYNASARMLSLNGYDTLANYQSVLASVRYFSLGDNPTNYGANGSRTLTWTLNDGALNLTANSLATTTTTIAITAIDDASVAVADGGGNVNENATISVSVLANDLDPDTLLGAANITQIAGQAATVGTAIALASGATATLNANGTISYNPNGKFDYLVSAATAAATGAVNSSAADSFTYTLAGGSSATVSVTVNGVAGVGDQLRGDGGDNAISGGAGNDMLLGFNGNDTLDGGAGTDTLVGGAGDDVYVVDSLSDVVTEAAGEGTDELRTTLNVFTLGLNAGSVNVENLTFIGAGNFRGDGNAAANIITGGGGNDSFGGADGADTLIGRAGNDTLDGGAGTDTVSYADRALAVAINPFINTAAVTGGELDTISNIENFTGGSGNDTIQGTFGVNVIAGGGGNDLIYAFDGADLVDGGAGNDVIAGGIGDDTITGGDGGDWLYGEDGNDNLSGTAKSGGAFDVIVGGNGADTLEGSANGFDYFYGGVGVNGATGDGNDTYIVRAATGIKVMNDFEVGGTADVIRLLGTGLTTFAQVQAALSFSGVINGTVLVVDGTTQIWFLNGTQPANLTAADFLFV
jgi:VCBS repeat-containing protein